MYLGKNDIVAKNGTFIRPDVFAQKTGHVLDVENRFTIYLLV